MIEYVHRAWSWNLQLCMPDVYGITRLFLLVDHLLGVLLRFPRAFASLTKGQPRQYNGIHVYTNSSCIHISIRIHTHIIITHMHGILLYLRHVIAAVCACTCACVCTCGERAAGVHQLHWTLRIQIDRFYLNGHMHNFLRLCAPFAVAASKPEKEQTHTHIRLPTRVIRNITL